MASGPKSWVKFPRWEFHTILIQDNTKYSYSKCVLEFVVKETVQ